MEKQPVDMLGELSQLKADVMSYSEKHTVEMLGGIYDPEINMAKDFLRGLFEGLSQDPKDKSLLEQKAWKHLGELKQDICADVYTEIAGKFLNGGEPAMLHGLPQELQSQFKYKRVESYLTTLTPEQLFQIGTDIHKQMPSGFYESLIRQKGQTAEEGLPFWLDMLRKVYDVRIEYPVQSAALSSPLPAVLPSVAPAAAIPIPPSEGPPPFPTDDAPHADEPGGP